MRATCEIIADLKDNKEVPYEELKMCIRDRLCTAPETDRAEDKVYGPATGTGLR